MKVLLKFFERFQNEIKNVVFKKDNYDGTTFFK